MPPWDNEFVCHSNFVNRTLQQVIKDESNNKDWQQPKTNQKVPKTNNQKVPEESLEAISIIGSSLKTLYMIR